MTLTRRTMILVAGLCAVAAGGGGAAIAIGGGEGDQQATGPGADRARRVALERYPGGTVNSIERESEAGEAWEVEVTRQDGRVVELGLDGEYRVVGADDDDTEADDRDDSEDRDEADHRDDAEANDDRGRDDE